MPPHFNSLAPYLSESVDSPAEMLGLELIGAYESWFPIHLVHLATCKDLQDRGEDDPIKKDRLTVSFHLFLNNAAVSRWNTATNKVQGHHKSLVPHSKVQVFERNGSHSLLSFYIIS
jgi:hypothetical protein